MSGVPKAKTAPWFPSSALLVLEMLVAVGGLISEAVRDFRKSEMYIHLLFFALIVLIIHLIRIRQAVHNDAKEQEVHSPIPITACLYMMVHSLAQELSLPEKALRATLWRVCEKERKHDEPMWLEQVTPYVGSVGSKPPQRHPSTCGMIGQAVQTGEVQIHNRPPTMSDADFRRCLVRDHNFLRGAAGNIRNDRFAWMAIPILGGEDDTEVLAVVWLDAKESGFFDPPEVRDRILNQCSGLAVFIHDHYRK